ncbi:MAG: RluA family pseudouridine synthase [Termitinemataceae bacterium]|nr:MAG: RluA family pseudouridine synthase [Termitinemataceae bacterium]
MKKIPYFSIIYEDDFLLAVNKSAGISVSPDRFDKEKKNLFDLLGKATRKRLWIVHRIDSGTSGLIVFAKTVSAHQKLSAAFERRQVQKTYITIVHGRPAWNDHVCCLNLIPNGNKRHQTIADKYQGKKSITHFTSILSAGHYTVVEAKPETGRTHQIRVHAAALGCPVLCDPLYGRAEPIFLSDFKRNYRGDKIEELPMLNRLALHSAKLELPDGLWHRTHSNPTEDKSPGDTQGKKILEAPLARDMAALISQMKKI